METVVYQGSTIDMVITLQQDGEPLDIDSLADVLVLFRYEGGLKGTLNKFKKVASGAVLAWETEDAEAGKIRCVIPSSATQTAFVTKVEIEVKVKVTSGEAWDYVTLLPDKLSIKSALLNND